MNMSFGSTSTSYSKQKLERLEILGCLDIPHKQFIQETEQFAMVGVLWAMFKRKQG